jgi:hypothetical protein
MRFLQQTAARIMRNIVKDYSTSTSTRDSLLVVDACSSDVINLANYSEIPKLYLHEHGDVLVSISAYLSGKALDTLHIIAHGKPGAISIGGDWLTADELLLNRNLLAGWDVRNIAIWACDVELDPRFTEVLAELTGAQVFASESPLGLVQSVGHQWQISNPLGKLLSLGDYIAPAALAGFSGTL